MDELRPLLTSLRPYLLVEVSSCKARGNVYIISHFGPTSRRRSRGGRGWHCCCSQQELALQHLVQPAAADGAGTPRAASAAVPAGGAASRGAEGINTSLATIPTGYFGGSGLAPRPDADIQALAQQRVIVIEKWEGRAYTAPLTDHVLLPPTPA